MIFFGNFFRTFRKLFKNEKNNTYDIPDFCRPFGNIPEDICNYNLLPCWYIRCPSHKSNLTHIHRHLKKTNVSFRTSKKKKISLHLHFYTRKQKKVLKKKKSGLFFGKKLAKKSPLFPESKTRYLDTPRIFRFRPGTLFLCTLHCTCMFFHQVCLRNKESVCRSRTHIQGSLGEG